MHRETAFPARVLYELDYTIVMLLQLAMFLYLIMNFDDVSMIVHKETHHSLLMAAIGFHGTTIIKCVQPISY